MRKKKIGIINFHFAYNYGAVLQCVALSKYLEEKGFSVEVINYQPESIRSAYPVKIRSWSKTLRSFNNEKKDVLFVLRFLNRYVQNVMWNLAYKSRKEKMHRFEEFVSQNLKCTEKFLAYEELELNPPYADCYIAGSDQIWNKDNLNGKLDDAYFLKFGERQIKRIVYGASVGRELDKEEINEIVQHMQGIDAISVREKKLADEINEMQMDKKVVHVCDPVFLLSKEQWLQLTDKNEKIKGYILIYCFDATAEFKSFASLLKRKTKLSIIDISPNNNGIHKCIHDKKCGPDDFLNYFKNASFIITDSFHATAFSIIFQKKFVTFLRKNTSSRMSGLLFQLNLESRIFEGNNYVNRYMEEIDYAKIQDRLEQLKIDSKKFLLNAIE